MTRKKRPHYQPPPDTVIDLVKKADIDGVKAWVKEHPDQINDANLRDGEKYFTGTLLHAAYSACVKFQPVVGAINAVKLHQFLLQQPDINPLTLDAMGITPRRAQFDLKSIVMTENKLHAHSSKLNKPEAQQQAIERENKERIAEGQKPLSERQKKWIRACDNFADAGANSLVTFIGLAAAALCPAVIISRICIMAMLWNAERKYKTSPTNPTPPSPVAN